MSSLPLRYSMGSIVTPSPETSWKPVTATITTVVATTAKPSCRLPRYAARSGGQDHEYAWGDGDPYVDGRMADNLRDELWKRTLGAKTFWEGNDDGWVFTAPVVYYTFWAFSSFSS